MENMVITVFRQQLITFVSGVSCLHTSTCIRQQSMQTDAHEQLVVLPCNAAQPQPAFFFVAGRRGRRGAAAVGGGGGGSRGHIRALATYTLGGGLCDLVVFGFCDLIVGGSYHRDCPVSRERVF